MALPFRRPDIPDDVRAAAGLHRRERVLAGAALTDGAWAVATDRRLVVVAAGEQPRVDEPWHQVDTGAWNGDDGVLAIAWVDGRRTWLSLADSAAVRLPTVLRERVDSTVVAVQEFAVRGRGGGRLVARRIGEGLALQVLLRRGTDPSDPEVAEALADARAVLVDLVGPLGTA